MMRDRFRRIEQKYLFHAGYTELILAWLEHACAYDPLFPSSPVASLYYDTPGLHHFHESLDGDFQRQKVRLRWYEDVVGEHHSTESSATVRCYLEIKTKQGALSHKQRVEVSIPRRDIVGDPFSSDRINDLPFEVFGLEYHWPGQLVPVMIIEYRRRRFVDVGGQRAIALDSEIRCTRVNESFVWGMPPVYFDVGVLESKGMNPNSNGVLVPIASYLTKSPFSKYVRSVEALMQPLERRV